MELNAFFVSWLTAAQNWRFFIVAKAIFFSLIAASEVYSVLLGNHTDFGIDLSGHQGVLQPRYYCPLKHLADIIQ